MLPLARALVARGHDVAFATAGRFSRWVEHAGFPALAAGVDGATAVEQTRTRFPDLEHLPPEEGWRFGTAMFTAVAAPAMVDDLTGIVEHYRPDLLVHEASEFAGPLVATIAGIPYVHHSWGPLRPTTVSQVAGDLVAPLWRRWGVEPDPLGGMFTYLYLDVCPPSFQSSHAAELAIAHPLRPVAVVPEGKPPQWLASLPEPRTVYVTFGTVFNKSLGVFARGARGTAGRTAERRGDRWARQRSDVAGIAAGQCAHRALCGAVAALAPRRRGSHARTVRMAAGFVAPRPAVARGPTGC